MSHFIIVLKFEKGFQIIEDIKMMKFRRELGRIINKNLFMWTILDKIFEIKQRNKKQLNKNKKRLPNFWQLLQKFYLWKEDWGLDYISTQFCAFLIFPNFVRS